MSKNQNELEEYLAGKLRLLSKVSPLNPRAVAEEREKFLTQAAIFRAAAAQRPSQPKVGGLQAWMLAMRGKQRLAVSNMVMAIVLSLALILGSTGATVYAAQYSLPNEFLYPVKTLSEDARLALTISMDKQLGLMLDFSNQRLDEIAQLRSMGKPVPQDTFVRTQEQLDSALQIAAEMNDQQLVQALAQIRERAEVQSEQMVALMSGGTQDVEPAMAQLQVRLQAQVQYAAEGEADPEGFRALVRAWTRVRWRSTPSGDPNETNPENPNGNNGPGNQPGDAPGQYGPGSPDYNRPPINGEPGSGSGTEDSQPTAVDEPTPTEESVFPRPQSEP